VRARRLRRIRELEAPDPSVAAFMADAEVREADLADALIAVRQAEHGHPVTPGGQPVSSVRCEVCRIVDGAL
jgi:hypothetical protein